MSGALELDWVARGGYEEAVIGDFDGGDGVCFTHTTHPSCYRRGPHKLLIQVAEGPGHIKWGCFDEQDQPERWYHNVTALRMEAESIASVLLLDRSRS